MNQLILTYNDITVAVDEGLTVDLVFFDYSKAFDRVSHPILLEKLLSIGVHPSLVSWIEVFLTQRSMVVRVTDRISHSVPVTSGVPQGSVLGPTLFLIYVNHVVSGLSCQYKLFTDVIKLYLSFDMADHSLGVSHALYNINSLRLESRGV